MEMVISILVSAVAFLLGAILLPGVKLKGIISAIILAVVIAVLNATVGRFLEMILLKQ